jgi:hypothetical protein
MNYKSYHVAISPGGELIASIRRGVDGSKVGSQARRSKETHTAEKLHLQVRPDDQTSLMHVARLQTCNQNATFCMSQLHGAPDILARILSEKFFQAINMRNAVRQ